MAKHILVCFIMPHSVDFWLRRWSGGMLSPLQKWAQEALVLYSNFV